MRERSSSVSAPSMERATSLPQVTARSRTMRGNLLNTWSIGCMRVFMAAAWRAAVTVSTRCTTLSSSASSCRVPSAARTVASSWLRARTSSPTRSTRLPRRPTSTRIDCSATAGLRPAEAVEPAEAVGDGADGTRGAATASGITGSGITSGITGSGITASGTTGCGITASGTEGFGAGSTGASGATGSVAAATGSGAGAAGSGAAGAAGVGGVRRVTTTPPPRRRSRASSEIRASDWERGMKSSSPSPPVFSIRSRMVRTASTSSSSTPETSSSRSILSSRSCPSRCSPP